MPSLEQSRREITARLQKTISGHLPPLPAREIYLYALLPPGKLFRPLLVRSLAQDLNGLHPCHHHFELFTEIHHVYTLLHDDLPCMDDDSIRRGKPATHRKFGEWQALLIGDGLQALSFRILSQIKSRALPSLLRYSTWALGPKGLIQGQYQDLSQDKQNFTQLLTTHKLKTSRLMQTALVGSALLTEKASFKTLKDLHRLGEHLGITFQLLDDLCELTAEELPPRENQTNPFLLYCNQCLAELKGRLHKITDLTNTHRLSHTRTLLQDYLQKTDRLITENEQKLKKQVDGLISLSHFINRLSPRKKFDY